MATGPGPHLPIDAEFPEHGQGQWDGNQGDEDKYAQTHRRRDKHGEKDAKGTVPEAWIRWLEGD